MWNEGLIEMIDKYYSEFWNDPAFTDRVGFEKQINLILHEIRSPLNEITNLNSYFERKIESEINKNELLKYIKSEKQIISILQYMLSNYDYLLYGKKISGSKQTINIKNTIHKIINLFKDFARTEKNIIFNLTIPNDVYLNIDNLLFQQVIANLSRNAIIYSNDSSEIEITYRLGIMEESKNLEQWHIIEIKNWGLGIDKEEENLIIDKYYRGKNAYIYNVTGVGLGLYVSKSIISNLSGHIIISNLNNPTIFSIYLPTT